MLNWKTRPWLSAVACAGLAFVIVFVGSFFIEITPYLCQYTPDGQPKDCAQHHLGPYALLWVIFETDAHNGAVIAIATIGLVYVTYLLVKLGKEQARITQAQIRASVFMEQVALIDGATPNGAIPQAQAGCPVSPITIQNIGDTTAHNVRHFADVIVASINTDLRVLGALAYPADMNALPPTTIGKGGRTILSRNLGRALTVPEISQLGAQPPNFAIIVYGRIAYTDAFGSDHRTDYCLGYAGAYPPPPNIILTFMTNGNYSD